MFITALTSEVFWPWLAIILSSCLCIFY